MKDGVVFLNKISGGVIPGEFIKPIEYGVRTAAASGVIGGYPLINVKVELVFGSYHDVDSSQIAFEQAGSLAFREACSRAGVSLLEPIMKIEVEVPSDFQGPVTGELNKRRGLIISTETVGASSTIVAEVPLAETFGYSTDLRSMTQGQGVFTMEFFKYRPTPGNIQKEIIEEKRKADLAAAK